MFELPDDFSVNPKYQTHKMVALWATEKAKIELSAKEETTVVLSEDEMRCRDLSGKEMFLEIPLKRAQLDQLISEKIIESIDSARETLSKAGLTPHDLERIVFVGGPTNYKPLRDKVSFELGIPGSTDVNPMTAVAEGASLFAESIDWNTQNRLRKNTRGQISSGGKLALTLNYIARTPDVKAKITVQLSGKVAAGSEFQIDSVDTGWTSGRLALKQGATIDVTLTKAGDNNFKVFVFDSAGGPIALEQDKIIITRTAATVDAIPASHSVGIEALKKLGGHTVLDYLVRSGDSLPRKGKKVFRAAESLKAGASDSLNFKLWEGEIENPITDNRPIGVLKISGSDFNDGVIPAGAELKCDYEILDSGNIILEVSVPSIGGAFNSAGKNFYSRREGQPNFDSDSAFVVEERERTLNRIDEINEVVNDPKLEQARHKLASATSLDPEEAETEKVQEAMENVHKARQLLAQVRKEHLKEIRQIDLDRVVSVFDKYVRKHARPSEATTFDNLVKTAQRTIDKPGKDFEHYLDELKGRNFEILWRQDWFVVDRFKWMVSSPHLFTDKHQFEELAKSGTQFMRSDNIEKLRAVVGQLYSIKIGSGSEDDLLDEVNIIGE